jgi:hypothetical protein
MVDELELEVELGDDVSVIDDDEVDGELTEVDE